MISWANKLFVSFQKNKTRILWTISLTLSAYFIYYVTINLDKPTQGFATYYISSKLLIQGEKVESFYNNDWFSSKVKNYVNGVYEIYFVNPPTTSLILVPLAPYDYKTARIIWIIINLFLLIFSIGFLIKKLNFSEEWIPTVLILFLIFHPLYVNFTYAQAYILIFFLFVLSWNAFRSENQTLLGILVGIMVLLKFSGVILLFLFLTQKKWRSIFWMLATIISLAIISLPWIGLKAWFFYGEKLLHLNSLPLLGVTAYQTIHSFFYHIFVFNQQWNPFPIIDLPVLGILLSTVMGLLLLGGIIFYSYRCKNSELSFSVFIIAGVVLSPISLDYHYIVLLLPFLIFIKQFRENCTKYLWVLFILFYALIATGLPYTSDKISKGWLLIFAYPKLYGALGLLGLFFYQLFKIKIRNSENISQTSR